MYLSNKVIVFTRINSNSNLTILATVQELSHFLFILAADNADRAATP